MKTLKKISLGLVFALCAFTIIGPLIGNYASALGGAPNGSVTPPLWDYLHSNDYHFWMDPKFPAIINAQIPKDDDPSQNHYVFQRNSTTGGKWVYTTDGTTNSDLFCSPTSITTADLTKTLGSQSNVIANFKYVVPTIPNTSSDCNPSYKSDTISNLNIDITSNTSGTPGTGVQGAACNSGSDCTNGVCQKKDGDCSNTSSDTTGSCESGFVHAFSWIVCPSLSLIDGIINAAYGQVENQLCFNTGPTSSTGGVVCDTTDSLGDGVKTSWNIFKNIASALLVIVMLVMVISQAVGGGPFDAYTVRKMLPKLVAAVIIMQLSYVLLRYAIDLSNDAGKAIGQLIMAPFGGPENMNLGDMIGRAVSTAAGDKSSAGGFITQSGFDVFSSIAAVSIFYYAIPALPLFLFWYYGNY
jgi:hypothetical protein